MDTREKTAGRTTNRLAGEKSPYLLQHAHNPVDWFPWGDEAFETARRLDRPVFLSIGYATCHWCHVMEKESFEDPEVAELMNRAFVSVKVDREERPDLDHIYMTACQMLTGSGGWPLTIVMTPERMPFFAATYIPPKARFGRAGMVELIPRLQEVWENRREEVMDSAGKILAALETAAVPEAEGELGMEALDRAFEELSGSFDARHGGFGKAPKFPSPHNLLFLLRYWKRTGNPRALEMVESTLAAMRRGGLFDHLGFGFHRYATDETWLVPHFEKMLYDQAMLATTYVEAWQATGKSLYRKTAEEVFAYVLRDMVTPEGGLCAAEDADSEGVEGKFYVWTEREIRETLSEEDADLVIRAFNVSGEGNFRDEATGRKTGENILHRSQGPQARPLDPDEKKRLEAARETLFAIRERRVRPLRDDKVLTDWNGLMIAALARGARAFENPDYAEAAARAAALIEVRLSGTGGRLLHRYRDGQAAVEGHLDDYAFLAWGLLELYEATFEEKHLRWALELADAMRSRFEDAEKGGFFFAVKDASDLIVRKKELQDAAVPSGNSVAALVLLRLARLTGRSDLEESAYGVFQALAGTVERLPSAFTFLLSALDFAAGPTREVVIVGNRDGDDTRAMLRVLGSRFLPDTVTLLRPADRGTPDIDTLAPYVRHHEMVAGRASAYVCRDQACRTPVTGPQELLASIEGAAGG